MAKPRVHEIAKEIGITSKELLKKLTEMGEYVSSASSTLEAPVVRKVREAFAPKPETPAAKPAAPKPSAAKPAPRPSANRGRTSSGPAATKPVATHPGSSPHPVRAGTPGAQTFPRPSGPQIRNVPPGSGAQACGPASRRCPTSRSNFTLWSHPTSRGNQAHVQGLGQLHAPSRRPAGTPPGWFRSHPGFHGTPPRHPASRQQPVRGLPGNGGRTPRRAAA